MAYGWLEIGWPEFRDRAEHAAYSALVAREHWWREQPPARRR